MITIIVNNTKCAEMGMTLATIVWKIEEINEICYIIADHNNKVKGRTSHFLFR